MAFERRVVLIALGATLPSLATALALLFVVEWSAQVRIATAIAVLGATAFFLHLLHDRLTWPLRTLANIVAALREGDYSLRARAGRHEDALGELAAELNRLADSLREQRHGEVEATALLRSIVSQIDVAIFAFDWSGRLQLINPAGERLLGVKGAEAAGSTIEELGLGECFAASLPAVVEMRFGGGAGRWSIRRSTFREKGKSHDLLVVSDLSRALREEELLAWQRLIRVLGHELNNSLAPIKSIAGSLASIVEQEPLPEDWRDDARRGLGVISGRADALARFTEAYTRLARLPQPSLGAVDAGALVRRVASLGYAVPVVVEPGPEVSVTADADQLEQALINLVQNAVDVSGERPVVLTWVRRGDAVELVVRDEGPGLSGSLNLFVPFFTTKPQGTGIGLVLARQIAEAHNGRLSLQNRSSGTGCEATLVLPAS